MDLINRICVAYNNSIKIKENIEYQQDSMWIHWILPKLKNILSDVTNMNLIKTEYNLSNPNTNMLSFGFDNFYNFPNNDFNICIEYINNIKKIFNKLCISIGLIRYFNPEGGEDPQNNITEINVEELLVKLDNYFGFHVDFPNIFNKKNKIFNWVFYVNYYLDLQHAGITTEQRANHHWQNYGQKENRKPNGEIGLVTSRGIITERAIQSLYFASRIKECLKNNIINSSILEIGGGMGRNAYYAKKLGVKKYIIIDLPSTCIMSSYYLGTTLGEENITLFGENTDNYVHILPTNNYTDNTNIDLIIQVDGLTEMGRINSQNYIDNFPKISPLFLSINHEANFYKCHDLYKNNKNIECVYRYPSWHRDGYIEELIKRV